MTDRAKQLDDLARLTDAALRAEQAKMAQCNRAISAVRAQLASLKPAREARPMVDRTADPAQLAGADLRWQMWVEERRKALNQELAQLFVTQDVLRAALGRAFGKNVATATLAKREHEARRRNAARRL